MFVLIDVCCKDRPIASATLMKRLANSVSRMGSGPFELSLEDIFTKVQAGKRGQRVIIRESAFCRPAFPF